MKKDPEVPFEPLAGKLDDAGLNLCVPFSIDDLAVSMPGMRLPAQTSDIQTVQAGDAQAGSAMSGRGRFRTILLIGNAGKKLWQTMPAAYLQREHPVDEYSIDSVRRVLDQFLPADGWQFLFPQVQPGMEISLQELGRLAGWHNPSPLGIGINHRHGLWFAYRAVLAIESEITGYERLDPEFSESPCLSCDAKPCLTRCPAQALGSGSHPDLSACVSYRVQPASDCASTCLARTGCPVAPQFQYSDDQIAYFYDRSLESVKQWVASEQS